MFRKFIICIITTSFILFALLAHELNHFSSLFNHKYEEAFHFLHMLEATILVLARFYYAKYFIFIDCMIAWKWSRHFIWFRAQLPWPNIQFTLWVCEHLITPLSFYQYPCLFEVDTCLWVPIHFFVWMLISLFLEPSSICCCMNFYLALESREYSHNDVGWIQVGEMNVYVLILWLVWG